MGVLRKLWDGWLKVGHVIGDFIGRLFLTVLYFTIVAPFGLVTRIHSDHLRIKCDGRPEWFTRGDSASTIGEARRLS